MSFQDLPALNATLNATAAALLIWGLFLIRRRQIETHRRVMMTAMGVSVAFLVSYLIYHSQAGSVRFTGTGTIRTVYFAILLTHTVLAAAVPFLATATLWRGWTASYDRHKRIARWTLPIWLYVSVTGVIIYWMLYRM
jgi:uncharacterized membrane protein YozB (DUF420 family)